MSEQSTLITDPARLDLIARIYGLWERLVAHCNEQGDPDHVALMRGTAYLVSSVAHAALLHPEWAAVVARLGHDGDDERDGRQSAIASLIEILHVEAIS